MGDHAGYECSTRRHYKVTLFTAINELLQTEQMESNRTERNSSESVLDGFQGVHVPCHPCVNIVNIGVTLADFQSVGSLPVRKESFSSFAIGEHIVSSAQLFSTLAEMPSIPGEVEGSREES
ncbi:hypothetical protein HHI36_009197 [Cryptolaemus montrouzieri]|uniref:Uncharacterized protein n=1 Tax=Cryptolaemus montrouzieri TaxID=559131 RepID=A0ABD2MVE8_9CUCU